MKRWAPWMVALLLVLPISAGDGGGAEKPPARDVSVVLGTGGERFDVRLEGLLVSFACPRSGDGTRQIFLLVAPRVRGNGGKAPAGDSVQPPMRSLLRLDLDGQGILVRVREGLPEDAGGLLAADLDGDGKDELLLARPGLLTRTGKKMEEKVPGEGEPWITDPDLVETGLHPRAFPRPGPGGSRRLWIPVVGALRGYGPAGDVGKWAALEEIPLPSVATLRGTNVYVQGPRVQEPSPAVPGSGILVAGPEDAYGRRLRAWILDPGGERGSRRIECWVRLPKQERVMQSDVLRLDGRPVLLVLTVPNKGVNLFGEKRLRLFDLTPDRTRTGNPPRVAFETRINIWQKSWPEVLDLNHDGREDLVLAYWKGLRADRATLDVYLGREGGGFRHSPRSTVIPVKDANRSHLDFWDVSGDGLPDMVVLAENALRVYRGTPWNGSPQKTFVQSRPKCSVPLPADTSMWETRVIVVGTGGAELRNDTGADFSFFGRVQARPKSPALFLFARPDGKGGTLLHVVRIPAGGHVR